MLKITFLDRCKEIFHRSNKSNFIPPPTDRCQLPKYEIPMSGLFLDNIPDQDYVLAKIVKKQKQQYIANKMLNDCGLCDRRPENRLICYN